MSGEQGVYIEPNGHETDEQYEHRSRAKLYLVIAAVCDVLGVWYLFRNVFLVPVLGLVAAFCSWRGIKHGGNKPALIVLLLIGLAFAALAGVALLLLLPNLPSLKFSHVRYVN